MLPGHQIALITPGCVPCSICNVFPMCFLANMKRPARRKITGAVQFIVWYSVSSSGGPRSGPRTPSRFSESQQPFSHPAGLDLSSLSPTRPPQGLRGGIAFALALQSNTEFR